jgi:hypothetical protein
MTIIPINLLSPLELDHLGNNLDDTIQRHPDDIKAMNRSLAMLGEELDDEAIENASRSEQVAS